MVEFIMKYYANIFVLSLDFTTDKYMWLKIYIVIFFKNEKILKDFQNVTLLHFVKFQTVFCQYG